MVGCALIYLSLLICFVLRFNRNCRALSSVISRLPFSHFGAPPRLHHAEGAITRKQSRTQIDIVVFTISPANYKEAELYNPPDTDRLAA